MFVYYNKQHMPSKRKKSLTCRFKKFTYRHWIESETNIKKLQTFLKNDDRDRCLEKFIKNRIKTLRDTEEFYRNYETFAYKHNVNRTRQIKKRKSSIGGRKRKSSIGGRKRKSSIGGRKRKSSIGGRKRKSSIGGRKRKSSIGGRKRKSRHRSRSK
jgi:hypothetical protein